MTNWFPIEAKSHMFEGLDDVPVIFHGVNKSGSKSMATVLRRALLNERRTADDLSHYHMKGAVSLEGLREMIQGKSGRYLAVGHYLYGYLPPSPRRIWVTQFRHPLPRTISVYRWLKNKHFNARGTTEGFYSFSKFVYQSRGTAHSQIMQFGRGFGRYAGSAAKMSLSAENLFELSIEALERDFTAIAIAEHFEESIFMFAGLLGLQSVDPWTKDERNKGRPPVEDLTIAERDLVREVFRWDYQLYDWALSKFKEQCLKIEFGPSLERYKEDCSNEYKDRLVGNSSDDAVARWLTRRWRAENPEPSVT